MMVSATLAPRSRSGPAPPVMVVDSWAQPESLRVTVWPAPSVADGPTSIVAPEPLATTQVAMAAAVWVHGATATIGFAPPKNVYVVVVPVRCALTSRVSVAYWP